jgi:hypothetical protein
MRTGRASVFGPWSCSTLSSDPTTPTVQLKSFAHMHQVTDTYPSGKRCLKCPPGTISHNPGSTTCTECGVGTYVSAAACTQNQTTNAKAMRCPRTITQHLPIQMHTPQTVSGGSSECLACPHGKYKNKTVSLFPPPRLSSFLSVSIFHSACGFGHREVGHVLSAVRMRMPQAKETWVSIRACATQVQL